IAALLAGMLIKRTHAGAEHTENMFNVLRKNIVVPISAGALYGYLMSSLVTLFPLYLKQELRVSETMMGGIITAVIVGTIASQVPIGRAADRFGKRRTLVICTILLGFVVGVRRQRRDGRVVVLTGAAEGALARCLDPRRL